MSAPTPTPGPTGLSAGIKYIAVAVLTIAGAVAGYILAQPVISEATILAAVVYVIPTAISEFEGA